jgi:hypothetical protein
MARDTGGGTHNSYGKLPPSVLEERTSEPMTTGEPEHMDDAEGFADDDPASLLEQGECPWCEKGGFDRPESHARPAHPDEWEAFQSEQGD